MSTRRPHSPIDLAFAPVLINIEHNLQELRRSNDLGLALTLSLNDLESRYRSPEERAARLKQAVLRNVDLHGLKVRPTSDLHGLEVAHGEYCVSVMLGKPLVEYVTDGPTTTAKPAG